MTGASPSISRHHLLRQCDERVRAVGARVHRYAARHASRRAVDSGALVALRRGLLIGSAVGLKLPEAPFAWASPRRSRPARRLEAHQARGLRPAALAASRASRSSRLLDGSDGCISPAIRCFPISTNISIRRWRWPRPIATCASCHTPRGTSFCFRSCSRSTGVSPTIWASRTSALGRLCSRHRRRACLAAFARRRETRLVASRCRGSALRLSGVTYFVWLRIFAIYRYIILFEMLAPLLIVAAVGSVAAVARARALDHGGAAASAGRSRTDAGASCRAGAGGQIPMSRPQCRPSRVPTTPWC